MARSQSIQKCLIILTLCLWGILFFLQGTNATFYDLNPFQEWVAKRAQNATPATYPNRSEIYIKEFRFPHGSFFYVTKNTTLLDVPFQVDYWGSQSLFSSTIRLCLETDLAFDRCRLPTIGVRNGTSMKFNFQITRTHINAIIFQERQAKLLIAVALSPNFASVTPMINSNAWFPLTELMLEREDDQTKFARDLFRLCHSKPTYSFTNADPEDHRDFERCGHDLNEISSKMGTLFIYTPNQEIRTIFTYSCYYIVEPHQRTFLGPTFFEHYRFLKTDVKTCQKWITSKECQLTNVHNKTLTLPMRDIENTRFYKSARIKTHEYGSTVGTILYGEHQMTLYTECVMQEVSTSLRFPHEYFQVFNPKSHHAITIPINTTENYVTFGDHAIVMWDLNDLRPAQNQCAYTLQQERPNIQERIYKNHDGSFKKKYFNLQGVELYHLHSAENVAFTIYPTSEKRNFCLVLPFVDFEKLTPQCYSQFDSWSGRLHEVAEVYNQESHNGRHIIALANDLGVTTPLPRRICQTPTTSVRDLLGFDWKCIMPHIVRLVNWGLPQPPFNSSEPSTEYFLYRAVHAIGLQHSVTPASNTSWAIRHWNMALLPQQPKPISICHLEALSVALAQTVFGQSPDMFTRNIYTRSNNGVFKSSVDRHFVHFHECELIANITMAQSLRLVDYIQWPFFASLFTARRSHFGDLHATKWCFNRPLVLFSLGGSDSRFGFLAEYNLIIKQFKIIRCAATNEYNVNKKYYIYEYGILNEHASTSRKIVDYNHIGETPSLPTTERFQKERNNDGNFIFEEPTIDDDNENNHNHDVDRWNRYMMEPRNTIDDPKYIPNELPNYWEAKTMLNWRKTHLSKTLGDTKFSNLNIVAGMALALVCMLILVLIVKGLCSRRFAHEYLSGKNTRHAEYEKLLPPPTKKK